MPVEIKNVLVCDAVDESCIQLLKQNGINVMKTTFTHVSSPASRRNVEAKRNCDSNLFLVLFSYGGSTLPWAAALQSRHTFFFVHSFTAIFKQWKQMQIITSFFYFFETQTHTYTLAGSTLLHATAHASTICVIGDFVLSDAHISSCEFNSRVPKAPTPNMRNLYMRADDLL